MRSHFDGLRRFARRARHMAVTMAVRICDLDVLERDAAAPIPAEHSAPGLEYRRCTHADLDAFRRIGPHWREFQRSFRARLDRGQICLGCFAGREGIGYLWLSAGPEQDRALGLRIRPADDQLYGFDLFVKPDSRQLNAGHGLVRRWLLEARAQKRRRAVGIVLSTNLPMLMLVRAGFGFRRVHRIRTAQIGRRFGVVLRGHAEGLT